MRKYILAALSVTVVGMASQTVLAADVAIDPAAYDWSGPYVGVTAGYGFGDSRHTADGGDTSGDFTIDGILGGVTAGWNHQADALVFGIEGDISASDIHGIEPDACDVPGCESDIDWLGTARLRAGFAMDSLLVFASGGLAVGGVSAQILDGEFSGDETRFGWTAGGGVEWAATESLSFKVEYLFVDLGSFGYGPAPQNTADFDENHIVRAGVNWHF
jgi:outer membrane immunogenic protein